MAAFSKLTKNITPLHASGVVVSASAVWLAVRYMRSLNDRIKRKDELNIVIGAEKQQKKNKAAVDAVFFRRLVRIIKIMIPGWFSPEMWYILVVAISLGTRTYCDLWMIENYTSIESAIIGRNLQLFKKYLFKFLCAMPAISVINSMLKYSLNELQLRFRARLTNHLYSKYLRSFTYYKMSNLDNRISNADQLLTQDVEKFCNSVTELYSNLSKPLVDITLYTAKLTSAIGISGPLYMLLYLGMSGMVLTRLRRPMGRMTVTEQRLEGEFRYVNSRLITNSEEIAFYKGNVKEQGTITATFGRLIDHVRKLIFFKFNMALIDNALAKYFATVVGYLIVCRPFLNLAHPRHLNSTHSEILEDYYTSGRMLVRMSEAIGRIVLAGREMTRLSGYTARVTEFMSVLDEVNQGKYERTMISQRTESTDKLPALTAGALNLHPGNGTVINKDHIIKFEHVPLVTPNGDVLVEDLNFEVRSGVNVLVCGPNGCGKSSLFRILGELWPLFGGTLTKPESGQLFYVPQRPYMTIGSLRDQVIYPDTHDMQIKKGVTDDDLDKIMEQVQLSYISDREHGWNAVQDWMDVLSGGEKQRIAMARLFYHKPQFAILDECTSAVSVDVEGFIYQRCKEIGITLFTVSHRKSLWVHHQYYLHMDGRGSFEFKPITGDTVEFGS